MNGFGTAIRITPKWRELSVAKPDSYDVVIIGGAIMGSAVAWNLACASDFQGRILVVEPDPTYEFASTSLSNSCMRQQFSTEVNIKISQYGADFVRNFKTTIGDAEAPDIPVNYFGYLYMADTDAFADHLRTNQVFQAGLGAGTVILRPEEIAARFPFYDLEGIILGSYGTRDEGYFDGITMFDWWRRMARRGGVKYLQDSVTGISQVSGRVHSVTLASGKVINCGTVVNAAGTGAAKVAAMVGLDIPVEPRKRYTYVFDAQIPLDQVLPLTIDPSGVHMRSDGRYYMTGGTPLDDVSVAADDFDFDHGLWQDKFWPAVAARIPAFEAIKVVNSWVGHYAYNRLDQNAIIGRHPALENFIFVNGFSGHGLQQSPAMGRGVAELITHGDYQSLDLTPLGLERVIRGEALRETAII